MSVHGRVGAAFAIAAVVSLAAAGCSGQTGAARQSIRQPSQPLPRMRAMATGPADDGTAGRTLTHPMSRSMDRPALGVVSDGAGPQRTENGIWAQVVRMPLADKVGQLLVLDFGGTTAPTSLISSLRPGGVIYFGDNLVSQSQTAQLSAGVQADAKADGLSPLLVMTDQEGGIVTRIPGTVGTPGGAGFDGDEARAAATASASGRLLASLGVNTDLAPDADVNTAGPGGVIGSRSFGSDPSMVSKLTTAQVCAYQEAGVAATVKHFPGHGSTDTDSHLQTAVIHETVTQWEHTDLPPFAAAVRAGVDMILVGHLAFPALDHSGEPATLSRRLNADLIRGRLGFQGVVITDALNMGGVTSWGSPGSVAVKTIQAGSDMLLMSPDPTAAADAIESAVHDGAISRLRLDESVYRIMLLKQRLGLLGTPAVRATCG